MLVADLSYQMCHYGVYVLCHSLVRVSLVLTAADFGF